METKTATVKGKKILYRESGAGYPVVLVHGNTGSSLWWTRIPDLPGARLVAPDLPNFGGSERLDAAEAPGASDIDLYADYLIAFAEALGLSRPVLVGHSLGGAVAISALVRRPELWASAVLVDSAPPSGLVTPDAHYPVIERFKTDRALLRSALAGVCPTMNDPAFLDELTDEALRMNPESFAGNARALARFDRSGDCGKYPGPVLVVWGRKDAIVTEAMARATAAAFAKGSLEILEHVGHSAMVEDPAAFREILARVVRKADPGY
ncbi:MAG: alpha/beta hydrolase [Treponema sp.]|nr:alpha/beta hydrolase [Treponema sp.]